MNYQNPGESPEHESSKIYNVPLELLYYQDLEPGDFLSVLTASGSLYQFQVVTKNKDTGDVYVQLTDESKSLNLQYGELIYKYIQVGNSLHISKATTSPCKKIFVTKTPKTKQELKKLAKEPTSQTEEPLLYNTMLDKIDTSKVQIGDFIEIAMSSGSTYTYEVKYKNNEGFIYIKIVKTSNDGIPKNVEGYINQLTLRVGYPLSTDFIKGSSSSIAKLAVTKVVFNFEDEEPNQGHFSEEKTPASARFEDLNVIPFSNKEREALEFLGLDPMMDPKELTEKIVRRAFQKIALTFAEDRLAENAKKAGKVLMQQASDHRQILFDYVERNA